MPSELPELLSEDLELLLREIDEFCSGLTRGVEQNIPESIENYLLFVAKTGNTVFPWQNVRQIFRYKLRSAIDEFPGEASPIEPFVFERFDIFRSAPFTIQRFAELITSPTRHYKIKDKFVSALEKSIFVVSTIEPNSPIEDDNENNVRNGSGDMNMSTSFEETGEMTNANATGGYDNVNCYQNQQNYYTTSIPESRPLLLGDQETNKMLLSDQNFEQQEIDQLLLSEVKSLLDEILAKIL